MRNIVTAGLFAFLFVLALTGCAAVGPADAGRSTAAPGAETNQLLTEAQAQQIALEYLGFSDADVTRMRTRYEIDDGIAQYEVEFQQGDWEYEFEIHGENGKILSYDKDHRYH